MKSLADDISNCISLLGFSAEDCRIVQVLIHPVYFNIHLPHWDDTYLAQVDSVSTLNNSLSDIEESQAKPGISDKMNSA